MHVPSEENATDVTESECPCRGSPMAVPDVASHNRMVLSLEPEAMRVPSEENVTDVTEEECPCRGSLMAVPDAASHNRMVQSQEAEAMRVPSGENATDETKEECPSKICRIAGHFSDLPIAATRVFGYSSFQCCSRGGLEGENGNADR
jgi:hypothetical protein